MGLYQKKQLPTGSEGERERIKWNKEICPFFRFLQDMPRELSSCKHVILQEKGRMTPKVVQSLAGFPAHWPSEHTQKIVLPSLVLRGSGPSSRSKGWGYLPEPRGRGSCPGSRAWGQQTGGHGKQSLLPLNMEGKVRGLFLSFKIWWNLYY